ncbi:MAG: prepilin-type N-terminal cleavage/methylation domain-containing protein [Ruminiclostridium sp.]
MKLKNKRGFTLVECMVALVVFALMTAVVSGILSVALKEYKSNNDNQENLNLQEQDFAEGNSHVKEVNKIDTLTIDFEGGVSIEVDDVSNKASDNQSGLQLNKLDATIAKESEGGGGGGGGPKPDIKTTSPHLYGTKAVTKVSVTASAFDTTKTVDTITLNLSITDSSNLLSVAGYSIKLVLPKGAYNVNPSVSYGRWDYTTDDYDELDTEKESTHIRFTQCAGAAIQVQFDITKDDYDANYGSFCKYFIDKDSTDTTTNNAAFCDSYSGKNTGYYNTVTI